MFLPTRSLALLDAVAGALPAHTLLAADFDALPETRIAGANAPLVATTVRVGCRYRRAGCRGPPQRLPLLAPVTMPSGLSPAAWLGFAVLKACPTVVQFSLGAGPCERVAADGRGQWRIRCASCCEIVWGCQRA